MLIITQPGFFGLNADMARIIMTKAQKIKIAFYAILILGCCVFGLLFKSSYNRYMTHDTTIIDEAENLDSNTKAGVAIPPHAGIMYVYGGLFVIFSIILGITVGRFLSSLAAEKFVNVLHCTGDASPYLNKVDYEKAEEEWTKNNFLGAIELFREYLKENPNEIHASLRIAEIYEKDLYNYLAAAMEYEEALKAKLPDEQWGWTAIHLCNLYIGKLNRPDDAVKLMKKIARDYEFTAAAAKAREHLERLGEVVETKSDKEDDAQEEEDNILYDIPLSELPASEQLRRHK